MKKKIMIGFVFLLILILGGVLFLVFRSEKPFYLEDNYYGISGMHEIEIENLNTLVEKKESFAVFVYQPMCITSADFENVLTAFLEENQLSIQKIAFSKIKDTALGEKIKYYPSFIIYHEGKIVAFLEADKDSDVSYYTSKEKFKEWFTKYVELKEMVPYRDNSSSLPDIKKEENVVQEINLDNIEKEDGKVNIYFFWGDGCPHCEHEMEFLESIKEEYGKYYNLYMFETWKDKENAELLSVFANAMNDKVTGVPYTIIGSLSFKGFGESKKNSFLEAIESQSKNNYDVYLDKIKK